MRFFSAGALMLLIALALPGAAYAHDSGGSFEATSSPYIIDIGYDSIVIETGRSLRLSFELWQDAAMKAAVEYDHVWVRIIRGDDTLLATGVARQSLGPTTLLYIPEEPGTYTLEVSYRSDDRKDLAAAEFPFTVAQGSGSSGSGGNGNTLVYALAAALLVIAIASFALWARTRGGE